jgi:alpha 1,3-glucosidase
VNFAHPIQMQENLAVKKRKLVTIVDPHIKSDSHYRIFKEALTNHFFIKSHNGSDFSGLCWPNQSRWVDFLNPRARLWWADKHHYNEYQGSTPHLFIWNDMNEPSVFDGPELTLPKDCVHEGGWEHRDVHNLYGFYQSMSTYQGLKSRDTNKRPFALSRSFYAGSQRYVATWTGDNAARWDHLAIVSPMLLTLGISGFPFAGADVGGFLGNPEPELLVRWYQAGAFQPFFRAHAHIGTERREPWLFDEPYRNAIRKAIVMRYQLLPYWYMLFHQAHVDGKPIIRPLFFEYPKETSFFAIDDQYLVGKDLLVKPVTSPGQTSMEIILPGKEPWYDFETWIQQPPGLIHMMCALDKIPVFVRGGAIIPMRLRMRRSSSLTYLDPLTLLIFLDSHFKARGEFYMDDGETFNYEKHIYIWKRLLYQDHVLTCKDTPSGASIYASPVTVERIIIVSGNVSFVSPKQILLNHGSSSSRSLEFQFEPAKVRGHSSRIVIKKPDMKAADNWSIQLVF